MSDELVEEAILKEFAVEEFDWRKLDINLDILTQSPHADHFTKVTLYANANWSLLHHWISDEGLAKLPNASLHLMLPIDLPILVHRSFSYENVLS